MSKVRTFRTITAKLKANRDQYATAETALKL